uniref:Uncharacterized protein n=1 Tax=Anopheles dirus TaxID=7168 RepID=A0A182NW69_9DIPT
MLVGFDGICRVTIIANSSHLIGVCVVSWFTSFCWLTFSPRSPSTVRYPSLFANRRAIN